MQFAGSTVDIDKLEFRFLSLLLEVLMSMKSWRNTGGRGRENLA